ncbi:hypothetical protein K2173_011529 [Erythroxylum novogranatense]|uniref:Gnk2-homologous domain-containing protein n=1 Tax=Erythroxylum novogranatense TaxID=1862640 RepID=A0AAV8TVW0_9ROSI|nr:hypothetical protein K2173_011529 [Erythroxylum novogranatense]
MDGTTSKPFSLVSHTLLSLLTTFHLLLLSVTCYSDYTSLVYHKCSNKNYTISAESHHSRLLSSLFQELSSESSHSKFYKSTVGDHNLGISGLFQCRGDLVNKECNDCVNKLSDISNSKCKQAVAARVQLKGCYFKYTTDGFSDETPNHALLHETCSENKVPNIAGFEEARNEAFATLETEILSTNGLYKIVHERVDVVGQCEADLGPCDCGICISIATQIAREDCGTSASGQVFYDMCFVSYSYHPDGNTGNSNSGDESGKMIAIALGGLAALFMGFIFCRFIRSSGKKGDVH